MLYLDLPTRTEFKALTDVRMDACVSIYLPTTPLTQESDASRIAFGNLAKEACEQCEAAKLPKSLIAALSEHFDQLAVDGDFWAHQANSLAVLATPNSLKTYRLANTLAPMVGVSDRFHLIPLLRAITFPHTAYVLVLSENAVRLVEIFADHPPVTAKIAHMPKDAASAVGKATINDRSPSGRIQGSEGQNVRLNQYARKIDAALRPILAGRDTPLILAAPDRLASIYRSVNSYPHTLEQTLGGNSDRTSDAELSVAVRAILDAWYQSELAQFRALYETRANSGRATSDLSDAARAATFGAIDVLLVDIDSVTPGSVDESSGAVHFADGPGANSYCIVDEIAARALSTGAKVLAVRRSDLPAGGELAAVLRYPI
ncbi:MAG: baeRF11 domain-containing protein [Candidatus Binatia bacterium]